MGDTNMRDENEDIRKFDELYGDLSPHRATDNNESSGDSIEDPDYTIDDAAKAQFQAKYGDEMYYESFTSKLPRGSVEDIQQAQNNGLTSEKRA